MLQIKFYVQEPKFNKKHVMLIYKRLPPPPTVTRVSPLSETLFCFNQIKEFDLIIIELRRLQFVIEFVEKSKGSYSWLENQVQGKLQNCLFLSCMNLLFADQQWGKDRPGQFSEQE